MASRQKGKTKGPRRMIHEIRELNDLGLSKRMMAKALGCSRNTVDKYLSSTADAVNEASKEYKEPWSDTVNWSDVESATSRAMAVSLYWGQKIATHEALQHVPYISFWREYRRRFLKIPIEQHKLLPPAERCEIDYKGDAPGLGYIDRQTREYVPCRLFGVILCFSQLFFPRATLSQDDLLSSIATAYRNFGGVPLTSALDNAKLQSTRSTGMTPI